MAVKVMIPTPLRAYTDKLEAIELEGNTVAELLTNLAERYEPLKKHLFNDEGKLRNFVNVYVNDEDIRFLENLETAVKGGDEISIVPAIAGG